MNTSALLITDATLGSIAKTTVNPHQNWISNEAQSKVYLYAHPKAFPNQTILVELPMAVADEILDTLYGVEEYKIEFTKMEYLREISIYNGQKSIAVYKAKQTQIVEEYPRFYYPVEEDALRIAG